MHYIGGHYALYRGDIWYYIGGALCILVETFMGHKANVPHFFVIDYLFFF